MYRYKYTNILVRALRRGGRRLRGCCFSCFCFVFVVVVNDHDGNGNGDGEDVLQRLLNYKPNHDRDTN